MKTFLIVLLNLIVSSSLFTQSNVMIGNSETASDLVIENGVIVTSTTTNPLAGAIKFEGNLFWGYDGSNWMLLSNLKKEILGPSLLTTNGSIEIGGLTGIQAADSICRADYPNDPTAHFYNSNEIDKALANGLVNGVLDATQYWVIMHHFDGNSSSLSDLNNCYCMLGDQGPYNGTSVQFHLNENPAPTNGGVTGDRVRYQKGRPCGSSYRIICGK